MADGDLTSEEMALLVASAGAALAERERDLANIDSLVPPYVSRDVARRGDCYGVGASEILSFVAMAEGAVKPGEVLCFDFDYGEITAWATRPMAEAERESWFSERRAVIENDTAALRRELLEAHKTPSQEYAA